MKIIHNLIKKYLLSEYNHSHIYNNNRKLYFDYHEIMVVQLEQYLQSKYFSVDHNEPKDIIETYQKWVKNNWRYFTLFDKYCIRNGIGVYYLNDMLWDNYVIKGNKLTLLDYLEDELENIFY